ncbi:gephyrin-like molybdotransferase Glp [Undibacterium sp. TJN19]|uniref:molybdopterin molybdotransferase MoeA n=1 Tax=Undibacterium sp. TJN19 TaxID=3413055 RepID=UPI003BEFD84D
MKSAAMPPVSLQDILNQIPDYDANALPVAKAQEIIAQFVVPIHAVEKLNLRQALGRVLADNIISGINVPAHDNSAMDGYALRGQDLPSAQSKRFRVAGTAFAGHAYQREIGQDECVRIMTGAVMPDGCDTVIPQELIALHDEQTIDIPTLIVRPGDNRRMKGEDLAQGKTALLKGKILKPADLGLLASLGIGEVAVQRRLRVAFFSTGDELRSLGETLDDGCVYDSNRYTLHAMLTRLGCEIIDMGVVKDDPASLEASFRNACENADVIITSGGVSAGAADYTKQMMAQIGDVAFWNIKMRPGRSMVFGKIESNGKSAYLFGLPGNPVAVMVTFYFLARHALFILMGASAPPLPVIRVNSTMAIRKRPGRTEYQRGILASQANGELGVSITGAQGSGILRSMSEANCMIVLHEEQNNVAVGDKIEVLLFDGFI